MSMVSPELRVWCPRNFARRANGAAYFHPLSVRRFAPANQRLQRMASPASKPAGPPTADPWPR